MPFRKVPCIPYEAEKEHQLIEFMKKYLVLLFSGLKLFSGIWALLSITSITSLISKAANGGCTDDKLTQRTFLDVDESMNSSVSSLVTQVSIDCLNILVVIALAAYTIYKHRKEATSVNPVKGDSGEAGEA